MASRFEELEKRHLLHSRFDSLDTTSSSSSVRYFASSSSTPNSPLPEHYEEKRASFEFDLSPTDDELEDRIAFITSQQPLQTSSWRRTPLTPAGLTRLALQLLQSLVLPLLPSFLFTPTTPRHLHATSHLDGLRGIAAFVVLLDHFVLNWYYQLRNGYLSSPDDSSILQLPIIRLIFAGRASVAVFFAISGFVLSYKPLQLIRANNKASALETLSSSIFRRGIRLYVPIIFGTLISAYLVLYGYYVPVPARTELLPPQMSSPYDQFNHWYHATLALLVAGLSADPNKPYPPAYNGHLWTIPIEFFGSMVVFLSVLGMAKAGSKARMCVLGCFAAGSLAFGRWDVGLFVGGVVVAEGSLICSSSNEVELPFYHDMGDGEDSYFIDSPSQSQFLPAQLATHFSQHAKNFVAPFTAFKTPFALSLLIFSLYLLSYAGESPSPGLYHIPISTYAPKVYSTLYLGVEHFFLSVGALLLLALLTLPCLTPASLLHTLQKPFLTPLAQYLGDISYALYIVHGMVLFTLGTGLQERWTGQVGEEKWVDNGVGELVQAVVRLEKDEGVYWRAFWLCAIANEVVVIWAADLFWRSVDRRAVGWGKWIEGFVVGRGR